MSKFQLYKDQGLQFEGNKHDTALSDKTNIIAGALLENAYENQESSKTLRCCKNCYGIGYYAKHVLLINCDG